MKKTFQAIERRSDVRTAMKIWRAKFGEGAEVTQSMGGTVEWQPGVGIWGHFSSWPRSGGGLRYWNCFGVQRPYYRKNTVIEINPPDGGSDGAMQGVLAVADDGDRWIFHRGRMAVPCKNVTEDDYDAVVKKRRVSIVFADGTEAGCHPVARIDASAVEMRRQMASFVARSRIVRSFYTYGVDAAAEDDAVERAEGSIPELTGSYEVSAQAPKTVERKHGKVWNALVAALDKHGVKHTNQRVGRWGPDLRTLQDAPSLFEIKVTVSAQDLQRGVGQLLLYERLLGKMHHKLLVLPTMPPMEYVAAATDLSVSILTYSQSGSSIVFAPKDLNKLL